VASVKVDIERLGGPCIDQAELHFDIS